MNHLVRTSNRYLGESVYSMAAVPSLRLALAGTFVLFTQTWMAHWNVVGPEFGQLHDMFGDLYEDLEEALDSVAERIRQLDSTAPGTLKDIIAGSPVDEVDMSVSTSPRQMIAALIRGNEQMAAVFQRLAETADQGTVDLAGKRAAAHEKAAWMLRSTLKTG